MRIVVSLVCLVLLMMVSGCAQVHPVFTQADTVTVVETKRDTVIKIKADAALIDAYLSCDSLNRVVMGRVMEKEGELIELQYALDSLSGDTVFIFRVVASMAEKFDTLSWIERHTTTASTSSATQAKPEVREPPWWYKALVLACITLVVSSIVLLIRKIVK